MKDFRLPDPGEGLVEAEIVTWRVAVGDTVKVNDIVVEIETSKSLVELPVPYAGTVTALLAAEGDTVEVGAPIISIDDGVPAAVPAPPASSAPAPDSGPAAASSGAAPAEDEIGAGLIGGAAPNGRVAVLVGYGPRTTEAKRRPRRAPAAEREEAAEVHEELAEVFSATGPAAFHPGDGTPLSPAPAEPAGAPLPTPGEPAAEPLPSRGAVLAKPPVRKLARDLGVDLASVPGSGAGGIITRSDVQEAARLATGAPGAAPAVQPEAVPAAPVPAQEVPAQEVPDRAVPVRSSAEDTRVPVRGVRKATAEAMVASAFTAPHVTEWLTCDVTATMELLDRLRARREFAGVRISPLLLVAKAVCLALARTPYLNSSYDSAAEEIVLRGTVNLGVAASTPRGLLVPNIKNAQTLGLLELAQAVNQLVSVAKEGKTQPADTASGTFTITNVGVFGVDAGTPILNPGESGILCLGAIARRPWVVGSGAEERLEPRWVTTLAVSFDHRVVDGAEGSTFLAQVAAILSDPGLALLF